MTRRGLLGRLLAVPLAPALVGRGPATGTLETLSNGNVILHHRHKRCVAYGDAVYTEGRCIGAALRAAEHGEVAPVLVYGSLPLA